MNKINSLTFIVIQHKITAPVQPRIGSGPRPNWLIYRAMKTSLSIAYIMADNSVFPNPRRTYKVQTSVNGLSVCLFVLFNLIRLTVDASVKFKECNIAHY